MGTAVIYTAGTVILRYPSFNGPVFYPNGVMYTCTNGMPMRVQQTFTPTNLLYRGVAP